jgi:hypothetical protein
VTIRLAAPFSETINEYDVSQVQMLYPFVRKTREPVWIVNLTHSKNKDNSIVVNVYESIGMIRDKGAKPPI